MNYKVYGTAHVGLFTSLVEVWKNVDGYVGVYQVSSFGRVRSLDRMRFGRGGALVPLYGKIMKQKTSKYGYKVIHLRRDEKVSHPSIHRLVAIAFIPVVEGKETVNHKDGNKENNNVANLEWATNSEQMTHAVNSGLVEIRGTPKFSKEFKQKVHDYYHSNQISVSNLADMFGISNRTAGRVVKGVSPRPTTRIKKDGTRIVEDILTKAQVLEIKKLRSDGWTFAMLAEKFNRGLSQMHRVVNDMSRNSSIE